MVTLLAKFFVKDTGDNKEVRQAYGMLCGIVGIVLNIFLCIGKFIAGTLSNSIAITADAVNNLSDAGSSAVTLIGFHIAGTKPDSKHPFGHGRMEYISGLAVAAAILLMAYELIRDSIGKILHPEKTEFSFVAAAILLASILVKLYMCFYNRSIGKKIDSSAMRATAVDSLSDAVATTVVLISSAAGQFTGLLLDGWCGLLVGCFILYAGVSAAKETLDPLLGEPPEEAFVEKIYKLVLSHDLICGIHDLIVHDYGPGRKMISLHAEVPVDGDILEIHDMVDHIENELRDELGCEATIHMDPIITSDMHIWELKEQLLASVKEVDEVISIHDFRAVTGPTHTNLIFDTLVPFGFSMTDEELLAAIRAAVRERMGNEYSVVTKVDKEYAVKR